MVTLPQCARCQRTKSRLNRVLPEGRCCNDCVPRPLHTCARCGKLRGAQATVDGGHICQSCYTTPARTCGICGRSRPIVVRASDGQPAVCATCYRGPTGQCAGCGRTRPGFRTAGVFHCSSCRPRPAAPCADCGRNRPVQAHWPAGPLCNGCYHHRSRNPAPCTRCGTLRTLVGTAQDGGRICGPCSGTDLDFACRQCGYPGDIHTDGYCTRCVATNRLHALLRGRSGALDPQLLPLAEQLAAAPRPQSLLAWLNAGEAAPLLADLARAQEPITHELLDTWPQNRGTRYIRELLVATGVLPTRNEAFARLALWSRHMTADLPDHQATVIGPFAEWGVLRDARRRMERGTYTYGAATHDRTELQTAVKFLSWLDIRNTTLDQLGQDDLDLWLTENPTRRRSLNSFIRWTVARRLTSKVTVPPTQRTQATRFLASEELDQQLRRCLTDDTLPLEVRIIGSLTCLYGLHMSRINTLTTDRFHHEDDGAYLTINAHPVLLPPTLAQLIERQIIRPNRNTSLLQPPRTTEPRFLFPGRPPSRPRSAATIRAMMKQHGLAGISARNAAMIEAVSSLPPIIVSDLFGVSTSAANNWAELTQDSWTDYLAACATTP